MYQAFAVVADDVKKLAGQYSEAVKNTNELIENSLFTVKKGEILAKETAASLEELTLQAQNITEKMSLYKLKIQ